MLRTTSNVAHRPTAVQARTMWHDPSDTLVKPGAR